MACEFDSLGHTWIVHGKPVTPMFDEDVIELIRDNVCDDCAEYVRKRTDVQGHYEQLLKECGELASEIYHQIVDDWNPGTRRTKKEQFAVDKVNQIMNLVNKNT